MKSFGGGGGGSVGEGVRVGVIGLGVEAWERGTTQAWTRPW